ncbi:MAG: aspartate--ammonia ligase [Clostridia bacterium]|nr:aspartate--ammonia ligase [Clostridia bacterium]
MSKLIKPKSYKKKLSIYDTQKAIGLTKRAFEDNLRRALNLSRVSAPLFVDPGTGLNDDLNGVERAVSFDIKETGTVGAVVHSLAKWKRMALYKYGFSVGEGLYADMNAIRRDEDMDNLHSIYVDQWDWEVIIDKRSRNEEHLKETVQKIVNAICDTKDRINDFFPALTTTLSRDVSFVTSEQLCEMYPDKTPKQREEAYVREHKTTFVMHIGDTLADGRSHDGRAPDYDDWHLNGDIIFWNDTLGCAFEVSSMGIRVDADSLSYQLEKSGHNERRALMFHKLLLDGTLPLTMGGGIGQSRLCMLLLEKAHIGEVQVSIWDDKTLSECAEAGIELL